MSLIFKRFLPGVLALMLLLPTTGWAEPLCKSLFIQPIENIVVHDKIFSQKIKNLRNTLSGKLATVWRSEWKTKLSVAESNRYTFDLINHFLTVESRAFVLDGLDLGHEGFTRQVHQRMYELQTSQKNHPEDQISVRDKPAPRGARDTTFTYYTKPIKNASGDGKHQVRIRTYLREIEWREIPVGSSVTAFDSKSNLVTITRENVSQYLVVSGDKPTTTTQESLSLEQMRSRYGWTPRFYAPHGKTFKLEIKSVLSDTISGEKYPLLAGNHMVQKLDVTLTPAQVSKFFAPLKTDTIDKKQSESLSRVDSIIRELTKKFPENQSRIEAVFDIIREGILENPDFLMIEGATTYHRTAFESKGGLQTTIDRDQGLYLDHMYTARYLKNPLTVIKSNSVIKTGVSDARHVELKVPVTSMKMAVGIDFADKKSAPEPQVTKYDDKITEMVGIYYRYVKNAAHAGKFNYIRKTGDEDASN
ncbi:MAG: hypothetical protein A2622_09790 [Bdellovibrionales bacterium RIFCSPHIGHO2_01_FULL_40_29]|nr:MAG: hypothetical protein A2622_09790 [Bdellovibrionales bacterium RIFCSPHIGHO2_01_FULL_40_29]